MAVASTEEGEKESQPMEEVRQQEAGKEEEGITAASETRRERCLEVPKNHHSRFVYTNPTCLLTVKGARAEDPPHVAFASRLSCINNNVRAFVRRPRVQSPTSALCEPLPTH